MKITKEVKAFAEREFDAKVTQKREEFFAPIEAREKIAKQEFKQLISKMNEMIKIFAEERPDFKFEVCDKWRDDGASFNTLYASEAYLKVRPKFNLEFDKVRFMAEISTGESLDSITELINKYFA